MYGDTAILWRPIRQSMVATSSNPSKILAIHEANRECIWLRFTIQHIRESCGLSSTKNTPTTLFEDNATCIAQEVTLKETGSNTYHRSSSTHMSSIREVMSIFSKYGQIWQIYSQKYCWHRHSRNWYIKLECAASKMLHTECRVYLIRRSVSSVGLHTVLFFLCPSFYPTGFFLSRF